MKDNFNLSKFLTENKLTFYGRVISESKSLSFDQIKPNAILVRNQTGRRYTVLSVDKDSVKIKGNDKDGKTFTISSANINNYSLGKAAKEVKEANNRSYTAKTWKTNPKLDSDLEQAMNNPDLSRKQRKVFQAILAGYRNGDWGRDSSTHKEVKAAYDLTNRVIQAYRDGELDRDETYASFEDIVNGHLPGVEAMFESESLDHPGDVSSRWRELYDDFLQWMEMHKSSTRKNANYTKTHRQQVAYIISIAGKYGFDTDVVDKLTRQYWAIWDKSWHFHDEYEDWMERKLEKYYSSAEASIKEASSYHAISGESEYELGQKVKINTKPLLDLGYEFPEGDEGEIVDIDTADYASDDLVITVKINHIDAQGDESDELIIDDWNLID